MADYYCHDCGCEIRGRLDIGRISIETECRSVFPGSPQKKCLKRPQIICATCLDDAVRQHDEILRSPECAIEAAFDHFVREFDDDAYSRELLA